MRTCIRLGTGAVVLAFFLLFAQSVQAAGGSFSGTSDKAVGGEKSAELDRGEHKTGGLTVTRVQIIRGGRTETLTKGQDFTVDKDGSSMPVIKLTDPLKMDDKLTVNGTTGNKGTFEVDVNLK